MKVYKKGAESSYTLGVFPTIELLKHRPEIVKRVVVHSTIKENRGWPVIEQLCERYRITVETEDHTIDKLSPKGNCFAIGVFDTEDYFKDHALKQGNHVVLVNPMDMGNMGTMMRTVLGFDLTDMAIIRPAADIFDPKVLRASMGAMFSLRVRYYSDFEAYRKEFPKQEMFPFMLQGAQNIHSVRPTKAYSLIFGNESSGLDDSYLKYGQSVFIPHTDRIDSLNLSMSVGIGLYHFTKEQFKDQRSAKQLWE